MPIGRSPAGLPEHQIFEIENDGSGNPLYIGYAQPGSLTSQNVWFIHRFQYSGGFLVRRQFANGRLSYDQVWDDRAALSYS